MTVMTQRRLEQLRRKAQLEGAKGVAVQDYIMGLQMHIMELDDTIRRQGKEIEALRKMDELG